MFQSCFIMYSSRDNFEEIIFPEGDPDAVSISKRDVDLLKPKTFVNDTIIDFYIMWVYMYVFLVLTKFC